MNIQDQTWCCSYFAFFLIHKLFCGRLKYEFWIWNFLLNICAGFEGERVDASVWKRAKQIDLVLEEFATIVDGYRERFPTAHSPIASALPQIWWWVCWLIVRLNATKFYGFTDEGSFATNESKNELKKLRAMSKASKQAELKRWA